jgi:hypothetical protein
MRETSEDARLLNLHPFDELVIDMAVVIGRGSALKKSGLN